jgi:hypothetical protein
MPKKIIGLLLAVLLLGMIAFFYIRSQKPASEQQAAVKEMLAECKYDADFCRYMAAQAKMMETGVVITSTSQIEGVKATSEMRMDKKGNFSSDNYMGGELQASMVVFEDVTYMKDLRDGAWYTFTSTNPDQDTQEEFDIKNTYEYDENMTITKVGQEACGELTCDKYEIVQVLPSVEAQAEKMPADEGKYYLYIDTKEHLARKIEMTFAAGSSVMEYRYEAVNIAKPSPIKEMPTFTMPAADEGADADGDAGAAGEMPSQEEIEQMMREYGLDGG